MSMRLILRVALAVGLLLCGNPLAVEAGPKQQGGPVELVYGQTVDGTIDPSQPSGFFAFDAQTGDVITITMIVIEGSLDPFLVLNDEARNPLARDDNSGGAVNARLTFIIPQQGRYIIQATHAGGVPPAEGGRFSLNLTVAVEAPAVEETNTPVPTATEPVVEQPEPPAVEGDSTRLVGLQSGQTVQDSLDRQVALRFYWFEAQEGDQATITPQQVSDFAPLVVLYDAGFSEIVRANPETGLTHRFSAEGIFFLCVSLPDSGSAGGDYAFAFDLFENPARQEDFTDIAYGQSQRGNIDDAVPLVTYRLRGSAGDTVVVSMERAGGDLNSYLYLLDGAGVLLFEDNDSGGENGNARITFSLPEDGDYLVVATRQGQAQGATSGSYLLTLEADAPPPEIVESVSESPVLPSDYEGLSQLQYGDRVESELSDAKFMDVYVFLGSAGDAITIDLASQNMDEVYGLDPLLILLDDQRIPLMENDDIVDGVERDARLELTLPRTAYYAIVATRFEQDAGTTSGPYSLTLTGPTQQADIQPSDVTPTDPVLRLTTAVLVPGVSAQATFEAGASLYTFSASANTLVDLAVTTDPGLDSVLILADSDLNEIVSSGTGALTGITLTKTARYLVILAPRFGPVDVAGGGYILALTQSSSGPVVVTPVDEGPLPLNFGETISGTINDDIVSRVFTFSGTAGDNVEITMEAAPGSSLDCYLELQDANGVVVDANDDIDPGVVRDSRISVELPADGEYVIIASRYVGPDAPVTDGAFQLTLERITEETVAANSQPDIVPLVYGRTEVGEINDEQYMLFYVFEGAAGDIVTIEINNLSGNLDSVLYLYQSSLDGWIEIASNDDSLTGGTYEALLENVILPQTGKYLIVVSRYGLEREQTFGTFTITLTQEQ